MPFCVIIMFTSFFTLCVLVQNLSERSRVESLRGDAAILPTTSAPRIIDIISATSFPIDSQTGKIILPKNITTRLCLILVHVNQTILELRKDMELMINQSP